MFKILLLLLLLVLYVFIIHICIYIQLFYEFQTSSHRGVFDIAPFSIQNGTFYCLKMRVQDNENFVGYFTSNCTAISCNSRRVEKNFRGFRKAVEFPSYLGSDGWKAFCYAGKYFLNNEFHNRNLKYSPCQNSEKSYISFLSRIFY